MFLSIETAFQYNWNYLYSNIAYIKHLQYSLKGSTAFSRLLKELMEQQQKNIKNHCIRISILVLAFLTLFSIILALQQFPGKQLHLLALSRIFMKLISRRVPISVYVDKKDELLHHPFVLFSLLSPLSLSLSVSSRALCPSPFPLCTGLFLSPCLSTCLHLSLLPSLVSLSLCPFLAVAL